MNASNSPDTATPGRWAQATLRLSAQFAESVSDALMEAGALSVSIEDAQADSDDEQPLFGEPGMEPEQTAWPDNRVLALFNNRAEGESLIAQLPAQWLKDAHTEWEDVAEQDWVRMTQAQFDPIPITPRLWIVPSWHAPVTDAGVVNIRLDPGLAFGTGSHPTTQLCLRWLSQADLAGRTVLDYGCGSGILAIAAMKLGAAAAVGIDIDPQAVESAQSNATENEVRITWGLPGHPSAQGTFPVLVANILSNPLKVLAPGLCSHVADGGWLVLSGVLERQAEEVAAAYAPWLKLSVWQSLDGWVCLAGQRTNTRDTHQAGLSTTDGHAADGQNS